MIKLVTLTLETYRSISKVNSEAKNLFVLWFDLPLHHTGGKSPSVFIGQGVKVNSKVYFKKFQKKGAPGLAEIFDNKYIFTQDAASAHTSSLTQKWYKDHSPCFFFL